MCFTVMSLNFRHHVTSIGLVVVRDKVNLGIHLTKLLGVISGSSSFTRVKVLIFSKWTGSATECGH